MIGFSVLMSLYIKETPAFLRLSLNSVFSQTVPPTEVILVEDGPITEELNLILEEFEKKYPNIKRIKLPVNRGLGAALNVGLKYCTYDLVFRMDTDDICYPDRFYKQLSFMESNPDISVCSSWVDEFIDTETNIVAKKILPKLPDEIFEYGKTRCPINHPAVIFRKKDVIAAGGYGSFPEDYSLWARMLNKGYRFYNLQESLLRFRSSNDVFKRRGGFKYMLAVIKLEKEMYSIGYISHIQFIKNTLFRSFIALLPNWARGKIYHNFLRK